MTDIPDVPVPDPEQDLIGSVRQLNKNVNILVRTLRRDYDTKAEVKRKRIRAFAFGLVILLVSQFLTVSMVSYCFLNDIGEGAKAGCGVIPGYNRALDLNEARLERFEQLVELIEANQDQIQTNKDDIKGLQREIELLEEQISTSTSSE